ncbi:hypothetical protein BH09PAT3_BH09PAT3_4970 [soil metagenome]
MPSSKDLYKVNLIATIIAVIAAVASFGLLLIIPLAILIDKPIVETTGFKAYAWVAFVATIVITYVAFVKTCNKLLKK